MTTPVLNFTLTVEECKRLGNLLYDAVQCSERAHREVIRGHVIALGLAFLHTDGRLKAQSLALRGLEDACIQALDTVRAKDTSASLHDLMINKS